MAMHGSETLDSEVRILVSINGGALTAAANSLAGIWVSV